MPKIPYTENIISQANNPLPFPNYLNSLSLLTDSKISLVRKFFNANKSFSEALLITIISIIQEGIAYQLANHSNISNSNNSKSYTNNTNFYCCKGVPIKSKNQNKRKRSNSFSYSPYAKGLDDNNEAKLIVKNNIKNSSTEESEINDQALKNTGRSYSSSKICTGTKHRKSKNNNGVNHGSNLKYSVDKDLQNSKVIDNNYKEFPLKHGDKDNQSFSPAMELPKFSKNSFQDSDSVDSDYTCFNIPKENKLSVFILVKNLINLLDIFRNLGPSSSSNDHHQHKSKPYGSVKSLNDKEKWEEFNRIYNETMYNLKAEEYHKSKSQIFKYSTGLNSVQGYYFDIEDNLDDIDNSAINKSMSILDEKIREKSENKSTDILSRIKKDTLTFVEMKECGEYMRRVGIYQLFIQCPINHFLRILASKLFSCGEKKYSPLLRFLFVTCVISPIQISINILCLALSNKKTPSEIKKCFTDNFSHILKLSLIYVPFSTQYLARTFLPRHLWVPFFNLSSFTLGTYIKLIMKKKDDRKIVNF